MRSLLLLVIALWLLAVPQVAAADLKVVTTTPDLASVARAVGGEHADVKAIALPSQDPHFVDARPHLALALSRADLLVITGLGLEQGWLSTLQTNARNGDIQTGGKGFLDASTVVDRMQVPTRRVDRSMGDIHPGGNPHYMYDPREALRVASAIRDRMIALDAEEAEAYRRNHARFERRVRAKMRAWSSRTSALSGAKVIAYHMSFPYLANWLGMEVIDHVEPRPGIPPNPRHVAHLIKVARSRGVDLVLQEGWFPTNTSELIAGRAGAEVVRIPGGPSLKKGESYVEWIDGVVRRLVRAAGK